MSVNRDLLEVRNITAEYQHFNVLDDISLKLYPGEIIGVIGRNGAGKSTLFDVIMGIKKCAKGQIYLNGERINGEMTDYIYSSGISIMPQGASIFPNFTIFQNLIFNNRQKIITESHAVKLLVDLLEGAAPKLLSHCQENIFKSLNQNAGVLSGGQRQIIAILRTLLSGNSLLLLDEPTAGLSEIFIEEIGELFKSLAEKKYTILIIEQRIDWVLNLCNGIYVIKRGRVVYEGSSKQLIENKELLVNYLGV